eukprot:12883714-Heterocapsa_arctica.AAC.1
MDLDGDQIRQAIVDRVEECWKNIMEHDIDGSALTHFLAEANNRKEWGGAEQIEVFAHIHKIGIEVLGYGIDLQYFDGSCVDQDKKTVR